MTIIYKHQLNIGHNQIFIHQDSIILSAIEQNNEIVIYVKSNTDTMWNKNKNIYCAMTEEDISNYCNSNFIGTVKLDGGSGDFIIHVLELL